MPDLTVPFWSFRLGLMIISASCFKAKRSALIEQVMHISEPLRITRHGEVVVRLERATPMEDPPAWTQLRGRGRLTGDPGASIWKG